MKIYLSKYLIPVSSEPIENGALVVQKDRIRDLGPAPEILSKYPKGEVIDFGERILLPGLVNAHCHLELTQAPDYESTLFQDLSGEPNFIRWLIALAEYQDSLKPEEKRAALREGLAFLKSTGTTTVGDLTTYEGALTCYEASGLRVAAFPEVMNVNRDLSQDRFEQALALVDEIMAFDRPKIRAGLAPYAPFTLSKNLLKIFYQHLKTLQIPVQIHTSQSFAEMEFFYDSKGDIANILFPHVGWGEHLPPPHQKTPIQYLSSIEFLQVKPALVGCVHLGPTDLSLIAHSGSKIVYCPGVDDTLQLGRVSLRKMLEQKIPVALGSDSRACNASLSLWDEMRRVLDLHGGPEESILPEEVLRMGTLGGAQALGMEKEIGSLEKGKFADFVVTALPPETLPSNLTEQVLRKTTPESIEKVFVGGETI